MNFSAKDAEFQKLRHCSRAIKKNSTRWIMSETASRKLKELYSAYLNHQNINTIEKKTMCLNIPMRCEVTYWIPMTKTAKQILYKRELSKHVHLAKVKYLLES